MFILMNRMFNLAKQTKLGLKYITTAAVNTMSDPVVTLKQGRLKGAVKKLLDGTPYYSFKGIPYAHAPVGKQRFMAPLPPTPWQSTYDATQHGPVSLQYDMMTKQIIGDENCLYLNVYTKSLETNSKIPVMVFIHGGAYMSGSGDSDSSYGPEFLLQHDVILVTINYRLEVLGFLCLDTPEVPGNAGMKDQVAALRWVQNNIAQLGGDPDNVTIFGESAGASSVVFHMHSPMSRGLFHKAIAQSGDSLTDWAHSVGGKERAFRAGKFLGKDTTDVTELLEYLRSVPAKNLPKLTFKTMTEDEKHRGLPIHFSPVIEKKFDNVEAFLTEEPIDMVLEGKLNKVPLMIGYNSFEGLFLLGITLNKIDFMNKNPHYLVPREIAQRVSMDKMKEFGERIKNYYAANENFTPEDTQGLVDMLSDVHFVYNIHRFAHFYSGLNKSTYLYRFSADTDLNVVKNLSGLSHYKGACHGDELFYLFYSMLNSDPYEEQERLREIVFNMTKLWTNFAKSSNPTPDNSLGVKWTPYTPASNDYLDINERLTTGQYPRKENVEFWNKLYFEAGLPCITKSHI